MTQINDIRKSYFEKGLTISAIAREYAIDRKTARKYIPNDNWNISQMLFFASSSIMFSMLSFVIQTPVMSKGYRKTRLAITGEIS